MKVWLDRGANGVTQADAAKYFGQERKYWSKEPIEFNGYKFYQRNDLFDPNYVDPKSGKTNLQLMEQGRAPIGYDKKPINLHHMTHMARWCYSGSYTIIPSTI